MVSTAERGDREQAEESEEGRAPAHRASLCDEAGDGKREGTPAGLGGALTSSRGPTRVWALSPRPTALPVALAVALAGCTAGAGSGGELPGDVDWLVALELDGDGRLVGSHGPAPRTAALPVVQRPGDGRRFLLLGYADADLGPLVPGLGDAEWSETLRQAPLQATTGCEPILPPPRWGRELSAGRWAEPEAVPPLTAPWLRESCEVPRAEPWIDTSDCVSFWCDRVLTDAPERACVAGVDLSGCQLSPIEIAVEADLRVCTRGAEPPPVRGAESTVWVEDRLGNRCPVRVAARRAYEPQVRRWSFLDQLPDPPPPPPRRLADADSVGPLRGLFGLAADLVVLNDRVVVSATRTSPFACLSQPLAEPQLVHLMRAGDELGAVHTSTAPPCLHHLEPAPDGASFFGAFVTGVTQLAVARFDAEGRILDRADVDLERGELVLGGLVLHGGALFVSAYAVFPAFEGGEFAEETWILRFELPGPGSRLELRRRWHRPNPSGRNDSSIQYRGLRSAGSLLLAHEEVLSTLDIVDPEADFRFVNARGREGGYKIIDLLYEPMGGRFFVTGRHGLRTGFAAHGEVNRCFAASTGGVCNWQLFHFPARDFIGLRLAQWPRPEPRVASFVGVDGDAQIATWLSPIDLDAEPYAKHAPQAAPVAPFPVGRVRTAAGYLWALVPDDASVLRIRP